MKILYLITQSELGGAGVYVRDLAVNLKNNHEIYVAALEQEKDSWLKKECAKNDIKFFRIKNLKREICPIKDLLAIFEIKKLIKKIKPDIVHLNSSKISILGSLAAANTKVKIVYTVHGWVFNEPLSKFKKNLYIFLEKFSAKFKDKLICVSEADFKLALKHSICKKEKLSTIHNGINLKYKLDKKDARSRLNKLCPALNIDTDDIVLGSIGNLYTNKGYEYLINTIKILVDNNLKVKHIILGSGQEKKNLENEIAQLKLKKNIFIIEGEENASQFLSAFDFYVCSSVKEGLSYTIIEAMLTGLPIVATEVGGNGELIRNEKQGILVESKNPNALARAILKLIDSQELSLKLAKNAYFKAKKEFSLEQMIEKTKNIYR